MSIRGRRVHIAGSAAIDAGGELVGAAHQLVRSAVRQIIEAGAGLVVGTGGEPIGENGVACIFDWTVLETLAEAPDPAPEWPAGQQGRFRVVASQRALDKIPESRRELWTNVSGRGDFELETTPPGWRMGGAIRALQVLRGDVLVVLGGGAGSEQLSELYLSDGKPVIPIRCDIGAIAGDGNGGSNYLYDRALNEVEAFLSLRAGAGGATAQLSRLRLDGPDDSEGVATAVCSILRDLQPPLAFYVRLLDASSDLFQPVERFFREVVDPVVTEKGFTRHEVGRDLPLAAFVNVEIFEVLHRAGLVVIDLTAVRPNCLMELGYALARRRRVIISAMKGTELPFDPDKLPTFFWHREKDTEDLLSEYQGWFDRYFDMPPIVD